MEGVTITEWGDEMFSATYGQEDGPSLTVERLLQDVAYLKSLRFIVRVWCVDTPQFADQIRKMVAKTMGQPHPGLMTVPVMECHKASAHADFVPPVGWRTGVWVEFSDDTFQPLKGTLPEDVQAAFLRDYPTGVMPWQGGGKDG